MNVALPTQLTNGAVLRNKEYAWELAAFPQALESAPHLGYACLGGQFWLLLPDDSLYELFWVEANSTDRAQDEPWSDFSNRSCSEVLSNFNTLVNKTDFAVEARKYGGHFESVSAETFRSKFRLLFNAYFITEQDFSELGLGSLKSLSQSR